MKKTKISVQQEKQVTVVIPAYNEENGISAEIEHIEAVLKKTDWKFQIVVVDDGSVDRTAERAAEHDVLLIRSSQNRGYGASLKAGIQKADSEIIIITDADGTYPAEAMPELLEKSADYDMVVGARVGENVNIPFSRKPAKWFLRKLAGYLAGRKIPDLNSGLRVLHKSAVENFYNILPSGFSFTTTITLAMLCNDYLVYYHPIEYHRRIGESKIRASHAYQFLMLILRTMVFFNPLKVFLPLGAALFLVGFGKFIYDLFIGNLSESAIMGFLGAFIIWAIGLLSDQIARIGLGHKQN